MTEVISNKTVMMMMMMMKKKNKLQLKMRIMMD